MHYLAVVAVGWLLWAGVGWNVPVVVDAVVGGALVGVGPICREGFGCCCCCCHGEDAAAAAEVLAWTLEDCCWCWDGAAGTVGAD